MTICRECATDLTGVRVYLRDDYTLLDFLYRDTRGFMECPTCGREIPVDQKMFNSSHKYDKL